MEPFKKGLRHGGVSINNKKLHKREDIINNNNNTNNKLMREKYLHLVRRLIR